MARNLFENFGVMPCHRMDDFIHFILDVNFLDLAVNLVMTLIVTIITLFNLIRCHSKLFSPDAYFPQSEIVYNHVTNSLNWAQS